MRIHDTRRRVGQLGEKRRDLIQCLEDLSAELRRTKACGGYGDYPKCIVRYPDASGLDTKLMQGYNEVDQTHEHQIV